jgi:hypothetical protein
VVLGDVFEFSFWIGDRGHGRNYRFVVIVNNNVHRARLLLSIIKQYVQRGVEGLETIGNKKQNGFHIVIGIVKNQLILNL